MDQNFRKRQQKTLYSGQLESENNPLALTELSVEFYQDLTANDPDQIDLETASDISSQETVSPASMVMSMIYARRLQRKRPDQPRKLSSSDLFMISMMMASKYLYDEGVDEEVFNDEWAENAGIDKAEINNMELDFLDALEWELFIRKEDFEQAMLSIERHIALKEGLKRGWFSYTDLCVLLEDSWMDLSFSDIGLEWLKFTIVSAAVYCVGMMALAGSGVLLANTALALASTGMTPSRLSKIHTTPAVHQDLPSASSLPHFQTLESPEDVSQPSNTASQSNDEEDNLQEGKVSGSVWDNEGHSSMPNDSMVDNIVSQLMAVLTVKSRLVQFVRAVSDGYTTTSTRQNHSRTRMPDSRGESARNSDRTVVKENANVDVVTSGLLKSLAETAEGCLHCDTRWSKDNVKTGASFTWTDQDLLQLYHKKCYIEIDFEQVGRDNNGRWQERGIGEWDTFHQSCGEAFNSLTSSHCVKRDVTSLRSTFPDVLIGFSTSMPPPVYAT